MIFLTVQPPISRRFEASDLRVDKPMKVANDELLSIEAISQSQHLQNQPVWGR